MWLWCALFSLDQWNDMLRMGLSTVLTARLCLLFIRIIQRWVICIAFWLTCYCGGVECHLKQLPIENMEWQNYSPKAPSRQSYSVDWSELESVKYNAIRSTAAVGHVHMTPTHWEIIVVVVVCQFKLNFVGIRYYSVY